jgi:3-phosphoshikimate 1-carboxyvinyltransferase
VKESDRAAAILELLGAFGVECGVEGDELWVRGGLPRPPATLSPARDHRIVMAAAALALGALARMGRGELALAGGEEVAVSYPGFFETLDSLAAKA